MSNQVVIPNIGESVTEADILSWYKKNGDYIKMDEAILELESDKATLMVNASCSGVLKIVIKEGTVAVGEVVGFIEKGDSPIKDSAKINSVVEDINQKEEKILSPAAKKIVGEKVIDVNSIKGTGKEGRITKEDVSSKLEDRVNSVKKEQIVLTKVGGSRDVRIEKMSRLRKIIASHLVEVQQVAAMLTTFNEINMSAVINIRKQYKEQFKDKFDVKLGFMSFFSKAATMALLDFPEVNAQIDGENIIYHNYVDLGMAVSTPKGLVVPVVRNAESMSFNELEKSILNLALKGRDNKLTPEEMSGGTFTITNGGVFGSMLSTPILNLPQSAILGMHNIVERPVAINGQVEIHPIMYLALSYDHRIIDGKEAVSFLVKIKQLIEDPTKILLGL